MKTMIALAVVLSVAGYGFAAEGHVADEMLAKMGLASIDALSDDEGQTIRGQGSNYFTYANTVSATSVPGAFNVTQATAINPNVSGAANNSYSSGYYNPYFLPPMSSAVGARGFAFAAR